MQRILLKNVNCDKPPPVDDSGDKWVPIPTQLAKSCVDVIDVLSMRLHESRSQFLRTAIIERIERESGEKSLPSWGRPDRRGVGGKPTHRLPKNVLTEQEMDRINSAIRPGMTENEVLQIVADAVGAPGGSAHPANPPSGEAGKQGAVTYRKKSGTRKRQGMGIHS